MMVGTSLHICPNQRRHSTESDPHVNYGLWVTVTRECKFLDYTDTAPGGDAAGGEAGLSER